MNPIIGLIFVAIIVVSYNVLYLMESSTKSQQEQKIKMKNQQCQLIEIIESKSIFDTKQYRYSCDKGLLYTVNFNINE